jgi:hypothetical protein
MQVKQVASFHRGYDWKPVKIIYPNEFYCAYWETNRLEEAYEKDNSIDANILG